MKDVKTVGSRASVFHGNAKHTSGGLKKTDLKMNPSGSIVSKKNSARTKRRESPMLKHWRLSVSATYKQPKYRGKFIALKKGTPFYKAVKAEYKIRLEKAGLSGKTRRSRVTPKRRSKK